jgi:hypothetical protein
MVWHLEDPEVAAWMPTAMATDRPLEGLPHM